jgi:flagellar biogenesis protein FliO
VSIHTIAAVLGALVFLTLVGLYAWMVKRFGAKRTPEVGAERRAALDEYRKSLPTRKEP